MLILKAAEPTVAGRREKQFGNSAEQANELPSHRRGGARGGVSNQKWRRMTEGKGSYTPHP